MHKKFLRTSSTLLGFAMMGLIVTTPTRGMDADDDPYFRGGINGAQYHEGLKRVGARAQKAANQEYYADCDRNPNTQYQNTGPAGDVVCACCKELLLNDRNMYINKNYYLHYYKRHLGLACCAEDPESRFYRWRWIQR
jgi:hypothetical protein